MRFVRVTEDSTREELATAALHLMKRECLVSDPATLEALDADIAELREMWERA